MNAQRARPGHNVQTQEKPATGRTWSPVVFALDRLFPKRGRAPYATVERAVVLVVVRAMSFDDSANAFNCFLSYPTIARWAGVSLASVKRALQKHGDGPAPLIVRSRPGRTRAIRTPAIDSRWCAIPSVWRRLAMRPVRHGWSKGSERCATYSPIGSPYNGSERTSAAR